MKKLAILLALTFASIVMAEDWKIAPAVSATWTSSDAADSSISSSVISYSLAVVTVNAAQPINEGRINFELSDDNGATYPFTVACVRTEVAPAAEKSFDIVGGGYKAWQCPVAGFTRFQVRLNPPINGAGSAKVKIQVSAAPMQNPVATIGGQVQIASSTDGVALLRHYLQASSPMLCRASPYRCVNGSIPPLGGK